MKLFSIILFVLSIFLLFHNSMPEKLSCEIQIVKDIYGDWERIEKEKSLFDNFFFRPEGMSITNDSIEFYNGFFKGDTDSSTGKRINIYLGNTIPFKIVRDSIYILDPLTKDWEFKWKFIRLKNDTLELTFDDSTLFIYKRIIYNLDTLSDFDQIIYSSSGCYGSCPIIDISVDKNGNVLFQGEGYVKNLGFYSGKIDNSLNNYIFSKFKKADIFGLLDEYFASHSDDQSLTTTFIKNGRIVKTIHDYGLVSPNKLIWAYLPIANIHNIIHLDSLPIDEPFYPKLHYFTFKKGNKILPLEKSESFYLWTELKRSNQTNYKFKPLYTLKFIQNLTYWGPDPNKSRHHKHQLKSIITDGQFYKFEFKDTIAVTLDLGYNFVLKNFNQSDFRQPFDWEE